MLTYNKVVPCRIFSQGNCTKGKYCEYSHVTPAAVARAVPAKAERIRELRRNTAVADWVLDTGPGNDLCPTGTPGQRIATYSMMALETANGIVQPDTSVTVAIDALNEDA